MKFFVFLMLFIPPCFGQANFQQVIQLLQQDKVNRSDFIQQKKIQILKRPLISKGYLIFSQEKGLYWKIESPLESAFLITEQATIEQIYQEGRLISSKKHPVMSHHFATLFMQLFTGNIKQLSKQFKVDFQPQGKQSWQITLIPKERLLQKAIDFIQINGKRHLNELKIQEKNGDSNIYLLQFKSNKPLTKKELKLFINLL